MMTYLSIDELIALRDRLTDRRDEAVDYVAVDQIDAKLAQVPAGERNDVDLLLGRTCAVLPVREGWYVGPAVMLMQPDTIALLEQTRLIFEAAQPIEY